MAISYYFDAPVHRAIKIGLQLRGVMAVQTAEAMAEWLHAKIRRELGFGDEEPDNVRDMFKQRYHGSRYSFGYPACPNMQDQYKQLELLGSDRIKM